MSKLNVNKDTGLVAVTLLSNYGSNMAGETCGFAPDEAQRLIDAKRAVAGEQDVDLSEKDPKTVYSPESKTFDPAEVQHAVEDDIAVDLAQKAEEAKVKHGAKNNPLTGQNRPAEDAAATVNQVKDVASKTGSGEAAAMTTQSVKGDAK